MKEYGEMDYYNECYKRNLDSTYDAEFKKDKNLTWIPWVGQDFFSTEILIVGESHYTNKEEADGASIDKNKQAIYSNRCFTREVIAEYPILGYEAGWKNNGGRGNNPTFDNLHKLLIGDSLLYAPLDSKREALWRSLAFMNIIQRPMYFPKEKYKQERPTFDDYCNGWSVVSKVIQLIRPKLCIFIGVSAANSFNYTMQQQGAEYEPVEYMGKIGSTYPRKAGLLYYGNKTNIVFIKHTSQYFSWEEWNGFIVQEYPHVFDSLKKVIYS
jgi:hypothetical protein